MPTSPYGSGHTLGTTMDYQADADPEERAAAVARWRDWLAHRKAEAP